ncbi:Bug family tripartite tricarboxylate transporter substrate binding protein [Belnapia moabensis]|uniref:Bug family tripartite tricarboxylate transporter substrate binding protein n=1 Tax=Belnapia moabensis TaxID=365533 RepID=UPI000A787B20|nr:tripartite tricarboxylate transporter substrate-binding protein [Belnapia moabensis]
MLSRRLVIGAASAASSSWALGVFAQDPSLWRPDRIVRFIVPVGPGSTSDSVARTVAGWLELAWRQPVVVENRAGAGTTIGTAQVARAAPDGYTLLLGSAPFAIAPFIYRDLPYDAGRDFAPVALLTRSPLVLIAGSNTGIAKFGDLVPGSDVTCGTPGVGTLSHVTLELLRQRSGLTVTHVPYRGPGPAIAALAAGEVTLLFGSPFELTPQITAGAVPLAVAAAERAPHLPSVPTFAELGVPGIEARAWFGLLAPSGTPEGIIAALYAAATAALAAPEVSNALDTQGMTVMPADPASFGRFLSTEFDRWSEVVRRAGIHTGQ